MCVHGPRALYITFNRLVLFAPFFLERFVVFACLNFANCRCWYSFKFLSLRFGVTARSCHFALFTVVFVSRCYHNLLSFPQLINASAQTLIEILLA